MDIWEQTLSAVLAVVALGVIWSFYKATQDKENKFNFWHSFLDADGKTSNWRIASFVCLVTSTWGFIHVTVSGSMSEYYFAGYMAAWAANGAAQKIFGEKTNDTKPD